MAGGSVADASAILAMVLPDEQVDDDQIATLLAGRLVAPPHWLTEVAQGLLGATRRGRLSESELEVALHRVCSLHVIIYSGATDQLLAGTVELGRLYGITAYAAAYLMVARGHQLPLLTADRRLAAAADGAGVPVMLMQPSGR